MASDERVRIELGREIEPTCTTGTLCTGSTHGSGR